MRQTASGSSVEILGGVDAAGVILILRRFAVERIGIWVHIKQHAKMGVAKILNDAGPTTSRPHDHAVTNLHAPLSQNCIRQPSRQQSNIVDSSGGRFFASVIGGSVPAALTADWLVSTWDQNAAIHACGPAVGVPAVRVLTSSERHGSIERAVRLLGLGNDNVVALPVDDTVRAVREALAT